ncbi:MAG: VWA domain-containing protein [Gammaproteobacteria bacterium]
MKTLPMILRRPQVILMLIALLLLVITFTKPTLELERSSYRYVFVFDISQSMNVMDVPETDESITRLEYAKKMTLEALSEMPCGTEAGLALFTGHRAFLLITPVEICNSHRELSVMINNIDWRMTWKARSEIAKGLFKSITLLEKLDQTTRLVFITDGHESPPINPEIPPRFPGELGKINGLIVGVGGNEPVQIPKFNKKTGKEEGFWEEKDVQHTDVYSQANAGADTVTTGTEHLSSLRETYLEGLADKTGLIYHRLGSSEDLFDEMETRDLSIPKTSTADMRWLFALGALLLFIATYFIEYFKKLKFLDR